MFVITWSSAPVSWVFGQSDPTQRRYHLRTASSALDWKNTCDMDAQALRRTLALASAFKEGDLIVGGTADDAIRTEARQALAALTAGEIRRTRIIDDLVSATLEQSGGHADAEIDPLTISALKRQLLGPGGEPWARAHAHSLPSEVIAAVVKVMTSSELAALAQRLSNPLPGAGVAIGARSHFGSRIQPNSPGDDEEEILFSILEGLAFGCGDVIIGLNPAADAVDTIVRLEDFLEQVVRRLELPTRFCVLSDIVKQERARAHTRIDVAFQSLAGTSKALAGMVGLDVDGLVDIARGFGALYFETGQGSAVTNGAAEGVDMGTLEARAYGVARHIRRTASVGWLIVNDVAGFIGPEVFTTAEQLERICLEDCVMAKLHGLTMGLDVCATFHMGIPPRRLQEVTARVVRDAAPAYLMGVAGNADPMLGYLTTSFREHPRLRRQTDRRITSVMQHRLEGLPVAQEAGSIAANGHGVAELYALYAKRGGDRRTADALVEEGRRRVIALRERGFDLGMGAGPGSDAPPDAAARLDWIYEHARLALYARLNHAVLRDACTRWIAVQTQSSGRDEYLATPSTGERLRREDALRLAALFGSRQPQVQLVVSDGLNANAINEHLRAFLPPLARALRDAGCDVADTVIAVQNGRVRVGYQIGGLVHASVIVHVVGERPGTGLNTLSAYLTYGYDEAGRSRWDVLSHAQTTAVCGVSPRGKPPAMAAAECARLVRLALERRSSGVALHRER